MNRLSAAAVKIFGTGPPQKVQARRIKIFIIIGVILLSLSKILYWGGVTYPNFELIIPTLVVIGSFSLCCGATKFWRTVTRYFGLVALVSIMTIDLALWGFLPIYIFTWPGFVLCWVLGMQNKLSMFGRFKSLLWRTTLTAAIAIIIFDVWTGLIGHSLTAGVSLWTAFLGQIPFTIYHLTSLIFIPPLVGMGMMLAKVKVSVPVAVPAKSSVRTQTRG